MNQQQNQAKFDALIDTAREKFRALVDADSSLFGGPNNARIQATIGENAERGDIAVPKGIDITTSKGLMAGVDLTILDENADPQKVIDVAKRAAGNSDKCVKDEKCATVCVYPKHIALVRQITGDHPPAIAVVGFPEVADPVSATATTVAQTKAAIQDGAKEIDMVVPFNFKNGNPDYRAHYDYIRAVVEAAGPQIPVKVILETAYLTDEQKVEASMLAKMAGATFVKTSTGFAKEPFMKDGAPVGATPYDVALMRRTVGNTTLTDDGQVIDMGVKASGGVRNRQYTAQTPQPGAIDMYEAGASRIGASGGIDVRTLAEQTGNHQRPQAPANDWKSEAGTSQQRRASGGERTNGY